MKNIYKILFCFFVFSVIAKAESGGSRGTMFINYHVGTLSQFTNVPAGNIMTIGGTGVAELFGGLRLGGGGGTSFIIYSAGPVSMGFGYGGIVADFRILKWLSAQCLLGGGGYVLANGTTTYSAGGFLLLHPTITAEIDLSPKSKIGIVLGYFLPNEIRFLSATLGVSYIFGGI